MAVSHSSGGTCNTPEEAGVDVSTSMFHSHQNHLSFLQQKVSKTTEESVGKVSGGANTIIVIMGRRPLAQVSSA